MSAGAPSYSVQLDREAFNNPEKWYVRHIWRQIAERRAQKIPKDHIKLLTLPGVECFDIRLLNEYGLIKTTASGFDPDGLAFCEEVPERFTRISNLLPNARRFRGTYESLIGVGRASYTGTADRWFPFDVINLDFSGPGFKQPDRSTSKTAEALLKTFRLQKAKKGSFSFFLTLPADPYMNDVSGKSELEKCLRDNLHQNENDFSQLFYSKYPQIRGNSRPAYKTMHYSDFLLITVPKIIIKYGSTEWFRVECTKKMTYVGEGHTTRMVSFCFECEYIGLLEGYGKSPRMDELKKGYVQNVMKIMIEPNLDINTYLDSRKETRKELSRIRDEARELFGKRLNESSATALRTLQNAC
jgi:hypothetical protein